MKNSEHTRFIIKLNRETKEGKINWQKKNYQPDSILDTENFLGAIYDVEIKDKHLRLYKLQERHYTDEDTFTLFNNYRLELIDQRNRVEWKFPDDKAIEDLYESVQYKVSNVKEFFDDYLEGEQEDTEDDLWP